MDEKIPDEDRQEQNNKAKELFFSERSHTTEVQRDAQRLEVLGRTDLSPRSAVVFAQCVEVLAELDSNVALGSGERTTEGTLTEPEWLDHVALILEAMRLSSNQRADWRDLVIKLTDKLLRRVAELSSDGSYALASLLARLPSTIEYRLRQDAALSLEILLVIHNLEQLLLNLQMESESSLIKTLVLPRALEVLVMNVDAVRRSEEQELLASVLKSLVNAALEESGPTQQKLELIRFLQARVRDATSMMKELQFQISYDEKGKEEWTVECLRDSMLGLESAMGLARLYESLGDKARCLYYAEIFYQYVPPYSFWDKCRLSTSWNPNDEKQIRECRERLVADVESPSKAFEELQVASLTAIEAKQIQAQLQKIPAEVVTKLIQQAIAAQPTMKQMGARLEEELGGHWQRLSHTTEKVLKTAEMVMGLPDEADFSAVVALHRKAIEVELREKFFRPFWERNFQLNQDVNKLFGLEKTFARFIRERNWETAQKEMTLTPMVILLKKAFDVNYCQQNEACGYLRAHLEERHAGLLENPAAINFSTIDDAVKNLWNPAVHSRIMNRDGAITSRARMIEILLSLTRD